MKKKEVNPVADFFKSDGSDIEYSPTVISRKSKEVSSEDAFPLFKVLKQKIEKEKDLIELEREHRVNELRNKVNKKDYEESRISQDLVSLIEVTEHKSFLAKKLTLEENKRIRSESNKSWTLRMIKKKTRNMKANTEEPKDLLEISSTPKSMSIGSTTSLNELFKERSSNMFSNNERSGSIDKKRMVFSKPKRSYPELKSLSSNSHRNSITRFPTISTSIDRSPMSITAIVSNYAESMKAIRGESPIKFLNQKSYSVKAFESSTLLQSEKVLSKFATENNKDKQRDTKPIHKSLERTFKTPSSFSLKNFSEGLISIQRVKRGENNP